MTRLRHWLTTGTPTDSQAGSVTVFFAISMLGLLLLIGLVADGGAKLRAAQRATATAAEAARAGGQALDLPAAVAGDTRRVDAAAAIQAAQHYLTAAGVSGSVTISADRTRLTVTVTESAPTAFLSLVGIRQVSATGHAEAVLVAGIRGGGT